MLICVTVVVWLGLNTIPGKTAYMISIGTAALFFFGLFCRLLCGNEIKKFNGYELMTEIEITREQFIL